MMKPCPGDQRQGVLDELEALARTRNVRHPLGLLHRLVSRAQRGEFVLSAALDATGVRRESAPAVASTQAPRLQQPAKVSEIGTATLRALRERLVR